MGMPAQETRRWTAREVRELIAAQPVATPRYELVDGELLVTPSPNTTHQRAVREILLALDAYLKENPIGEVLTSPSDVEVVPESITQPDVYVMPLAESDRIGPDSLPVRELMLSVEVLSPSSARYDRQKKRALYQRAVPEYWVVDTDARLIERWRSGDSRPEILADHIEWLPQGATQRFMLDLEAFFRRVWRET